MCIVNQKATMFEFYTTDSNLLALLVCLIYSVYLIRNLVTGNECIPTWLRQVKYMATCCLTVTFVIVLTVLAPMMGLMGYRVMLFEGLMIYHHLLCPILMIFVFLFFDSDGIYNRKKVTATIIPTALYAVVIVVLNVRRTISGPYPFLMVYQQTVYVSVFWFLVIHSIAFFIAWFLLKISKKTSQA